MHWNFEQPQLLRDVATALVLKSDDIFFTVGGDRGRQLRADFLGVRLFDGLASDAFLSDNDFAAIDPHRFEITRHALSLLAMIDARGLGAKSRPHVPDTEITRNFELDFLEHFLSTLPTGELGVWDATHVRNGALKRLFDVSATWLNLIDAIRETFLDNAELFQLRVADLALLSGLELRTMRNRVGPDKPIRTTPKRRHQARRGLSDPAFVKVHTLDAVAWLIARPSFEIASIDTDWVGRQIHDLSTRAAIGRAAVMTGWLNVGPTKKLAAELDWNENQIVEWAESGPTDNADDAKDLAALVGLNPAQYAARCKVTS